MIWKTFFIMTLLGALSCHHRQAAPAFAKHDTLRTSTPAKPNLKGLTFALQKDPACGMPLHAGLEDTTIYQGKLYGFCSAACKEAFLKNPAEFLAETAK